MQGRWYWFLKTLRPIVGAIAIAYVILTRETLLHEEVNVIIIVSLIIILVFLFILYHAYKSSKVKEI
jgi:hypothetical protein